MLSVIDLKNITFERTYPYTRNRQGRMVQEPYFIINESEKTYHLKGRLIMWSFLDSLYHDNPLPRGPVEDDLFAPTIGTPSMLSLFKEFTEEGSATNRYLIFEHDSNNSVLLVRSLDQYVLSNDIEKVDAMFASTGFSTQHKPTVYTDSKKVHLRPSLFCRIGEYTLRVTDLGPSYYISVTAMDRAGKKYCLLPPRTCKKDDKNVQSALQVILAFIEDGLSVEMARELPTIPAVDESPYLMTRELDTLLHDRLRRCI